MSSYAHPALTLAIAEQLLDAATRRAEEIGVPMSLCVLDEGGHQIAARRMDGARWITVSIATGKAMTAAAWQMPAREVGERLSQAPALVTSIIVQQHGSFSAADGGYPLIADGAIVGGMGASGGTGAQDGDVVTTAIEAVFGASHGAA